MTRILDKGGQGILEALLSLPLFLSFFAGLGYLIYFGLIYQIANYHLHEALLCSQSQPITRCQQTHSKSLKKVLIFDEDLRLHLYSERKDLKAELLISFKPPIKIRQSVAKGF